MALCQSVRESEYQVTGCQCVRVAACLSVSVSECQSVRVSAFQSVRLSECQGVKVSEFQGLDCQKMPECLSVPVLGLFDEVKC